MSTNLFKPFGMLVAAEFQALTKTSNVFVADIDGDDLYAKYIAAFPEGTNPIYIKTTEHDCSCCRHFIRRAGAVITLHDGKISTVWDTAAEKAPGFYRDVAAALRDAVRAAGVRDLFKVGKNERSFGAAQTISLNMAHTALTWDHLHTGDVPATVRDALPDTARGNYRTTVQVFERGLSELSPEAVDTVISLVNANNLYRGQEHLPALLQFQKIQRRFLASSQQTRQLFTWENANTPAARFRNTVIGTLVQDLSEGQDLERAVKSFETKVAPQNYKRTTALITPGMVNKALETITSLGLESALERRFAVLSDVSVNDVKWVDGQVKPLMKGGIGDVLMKHVKASTVDVQKDEERAEEIALDDFMAKILPETQSVQLLFKGEHVGNLMSITAPCSPEPKQLFRWTNDFAWSYGGNVADSIKERVKQAGGKVDGAVLRVSLSWFNFDDLDLHIEQPSGRGVSSLKDIIYFGNKRGWTGGCLDVDMNAGGGTTRTPVENVSWASTPPNGAYGIVVNNFRRRETSDPGFVIEVESGGKLSHFSYNKGVEDKKSILVATLHLQGGVIIRTDAIAPGITSTNISQDKWGLKTEQYVKVNAVMLSPNYWGDNRVGNKHTFFVLEGAKSDEDTRGFYNEFLHPRLEPHRKVFEVIADKTKCRPTENQLSGLGFSSTKKDNFIVRVQQGNKQRLFNVQVNP